MSDLKKSFIKKIFNLGVFHHKSSLKQRKLVLDSIYKELYINSISKDLNLLEEFLLMDINLHEFCTKNSLDLNKIKYKFDKLTNLLKKSKHTKDILSCSSTGIIEIRRWRMYWIQAITIYKEKNNINGKKQSKKG